VFNLKTFPKKRRAYQNKVSRNTIKGMTTLIVNFKIDSQHFASIQTRTTTRTVFYEYEAKQEDDQAYAQGGKCAFCARTNTSQEGQ
jgi:hypothetical protein